MAEKTSMDVERIRSLVQLMVDNDLAHIDLRNGDQRISLRRGPLGGPLVTTSPAVAAAPVVAPVAPAAAAPAPPAAPADDLVPIPSPMVGTFYAAPSPDSAPFVSVGANIGDDTVVCIVEAMKVMNEIKAETRGTIAKILVNNGQAVEYGQPMFLVKKS